MKGVADGNTNNGQSEEHKGSAEGDTDQAMKEIEKKDGKIASLEAELAALRKTSAGEQAARAKKKSSEVRKVLGQLVTEEVAKQCLPHSNNSVLAIGGATQTRRRRRRRRRSSGVSRRRRRSKTQRRRKSTKFGSEDHTMEFASTGRTLLTAFDKRDSSPSALADCKKELHNFFKLAQREELEEAGKAEGLSTVGAADLQRLLSPQGPTGQESQANDSVSELSHKKAHLRAADEHKHAPHDNNCAGLLGCSSFGITSTDNKPEFSGSEVISLRCKSLTMGKCGSTIGCEWAETTCKDASSWECSVRRKIFNCWTAPQFSWRRIAEGGQPRDIARDQGCGKLALGDISCTFSFNRDERLQIASHLC